MDEPHEVPEDYGPMEAAAEFREKHEIPLSHALRNTPILFDFLAQLQVAAVQNMRDRQTDANSVQLLDVSDGFAQRQTAYNLGAAEAFRTVAEELASALNMRYNESDTHETR